MVLDEQRDRATKIIRPLARYFIKVEPNTLSVVAFLFSVLAFLVLYLLAPDNFIFYSETWSVYFLILASVFILLNGLFDIIDGLVAKMSKKASKKGDFIDHVFDRYADIFILSGIIVSGYVNFYIGLFALVGVFMTSYMGTQAQALGVKRDYGGILGRADRLGLLFLFPILLFLHIQFFDGPILLSISELTLDLTLFDIMMLWFGIAGNFTAIQRARRTWKV
ncbi:MAG: CDP-alcohol phosphatidyltransferase family protein, partial [Thermoplasmata archaeon]|nr:CDP-alcohol phosphatidyltransferase family protein [Thermoplasmata archaeon]